MRYYLFKEGQEHNIRRSRATVIARNRLIILILSIMFCIFGAIFMFSMKSNASDPVEVSYISVEVNSGDTLWSICRDNYSSCNDDFDGYVREVRKLNGLTSDTIHAGSKLVIPCYYHKN